MSKNNSFRILHAGRFDHGNVTLSMHKANYDADYTDNQYQYIHSEWMRRLNDAKDKGQELFNSKIFRLGSIDNTKLGELHFQLGITDYKEYVATRSPLKDIPRADPIGTSIIPLTRDQLIPIGRRSPRAEVNPGKFFTFGGFFDAELDKVNTKPDVFACAQRELGEELGIKVQKTEFKLIGVIYDLVNLHPEISFTVNLSVDSTELLEDSWNVELADIEFIPIKKIASFLNRYREDFTPTLAGALDISIGHWY